MIVRPQQHWLRRIFVWHGSVLSKISSRLLLNFVFSIAVIFMLPWYTHLGIKFTLAPFSILGVAIAIFLGFRNNAGFGKCKGVCPAANRFRPLFTHDITQTATGGSAGSLSQD